MIRHAITVYLPWFLSLITIWLNILAGEKKQSAWLVGLVGQLLWSVWIIVSENYGFVPLNIMLWLIYARNHYLWNKPNA